MNTVRIERENRCKLNTHNTTTGICQFSCVYIVYVQYFILAFLFTLKPTSVLVFHSALENLQGLKALFSRLPPAIQTAACFSFCHTIHAVHPSGPTGAIRASRSALIAVAVITIHTAALQSLKASASQTCTMSLTTALSMLILASCSPEMFFPTQVMKVNLARLLMASPVVIRTKANRRASSGEGDETNSDRKNNKNAFKSIQVKKKEANDYTWNLREVSLIIVYKQIMFVLDNRLSHEGLK